MRRTIIISLLAVVLLIVMAVGSSSFAREAPEKEKKLTKNKVFLSPTGDDPALSLLNINNMTYWVKFNGESAHSRNDDSGIYFPRGMVWCIYKDGIKWSGRCYLDEDMTIPAPEQRIRIGGNDYGVGSTNGGWVEGSGATAQRISTADPRVRVWRIRRDYYTEMIDSEGEWTGVMKMDAKEFNELGGGEDPSDADMQEIWDFYESDWTNWPVDLGAPYIDRNGNGVFDPPPAFSADFTVEDLIPGGYDEPGLAGKDPNSPADQVLWNVFNDLDETLTLDKEGSYPFGFELQRTVWGYKRTDALGNIFFEQVLIINKGGVDVGGGNLGTFWMDSCWVCQWSDPDLGSAFDDLVGCDTTLSMGYVYNANALDYEYTRYKQTVPAAGYDFLGGPLVVSPGDQAIFNLKPKPDFKNLPMTTFFWFSAGSAISDPGGDYEGGLEWDAMHRGFQPHADVDEPYPFPPGVRPSKFPLSGDPVMGTGLVDGLGELYSFAPGDRRLGMTSGPFQMAPGDTQQVVMGFIVGQGADRFSSISVMKFNDRLAQLTYDNLFQVPSAPAAPNVKVTELDGKVLLNWGHDFDQLAMIEGTVSNPGNYTFEGYNVYQFPRATSNLTESVRLATYDKVTNPPIVFDDQFDPVSGQILFMPVQYGSNAGLQRYYTLDRDYVRDIARIYNGEEYYMAVTAYAVALDEGAIPKTLESLPQVVTVVPHREMMGTRYGAEDLETISTDDITHPFGTGDIQILPLVVTPQDIIDADYTVEFNQDTIWEVVLGDSIYHFSYDFMKNGQEIEADLDNFSLNEIYPILDGILWKVGGLTFAAPTDFTDYTVVGTGDYDIDSYAVNGWSNTADALDAYGDGTTDLLLLQGDIQLRFTGEYDAKSGTVIPVKEGTGSLATVYSANGMADHPLNPNPGSTDRFTVRIPFEAWDMERDMQINVLMRVRMQSSTADPFYAFDPADRMYVFFNALPYKETVLTEAEDASLTWNMVFWEMDWDEGDVLTFKYANKVQPDELFVIDTGPYVQTLDAETAENDVERITVYPNPYYAFNPAELTRLSRFVTFNNLPKKAKIRIFNLAGHLVATIDKDGDSPFQRWDLLNHDGLPVASGMYIAHITMTLPTGGEAEKIVKLAVILEQEVLDVY